MPHEGKFGEFEPTGLADGAENLANQTIIVVNQTIVGHIHNMDDIIQTIVDVSQTIVDTIHNVDDINQTIVGHIHNVVDDIHGVDEDNRGIGDDDGTRAPKTKRGMDAHPPLGES